MTADDDLLSTFDVEEMAPEALLFQTGYLTIVDEKDEGDGPVYRLGYPNREVRQSLNRQLLRAATPTRRALSGARLRELFAANDFAGVEALFRSCFDAIPYEWHTRNEIARYEGYYASVLYSHLAAAGMDVAVEDSSNRGRLDLAVRCGGQVYLFECKAAEQEPSGAALAQLRERDYAAKYRASGRPVHLPMTPRQVLPPATPPATPHLPRSRQVPAGKCGRLPDPRRHLRFVERALADVDPARVLVLARAGRDGSQRRHGRTSPSRSG